MAEILLQDFCVFSINNIGSKHFIPIHFFISYVSTTFRGCVFLLVFVFILFLIFLNFFFILFLFLLSPFFKVCVYFFLYYYYFCGIQTTWRNDKIFYCESRRRPWFVSLSNYSARVKVLLDMKLTLPYQNLKL